MQIRHDPDADAMTIVLNDGKYDRSQMITPHCIVDLDSQGNVIAIELLKVSRHVTAPTLFEYIDITRKLAAVKPDGV